MKSIQPLIREAATLIKRNGGVTIDLRNRRAVKLGNVWVYPKYPDLTVIKSLNSDLSKLLEGFIRHNEDKLLEDKCYLGVWENPKTSDYYIDIITFESELVTAINKAKECGKKRGRNIVAIYNDFLRKTVYL